MTLARWEPFRELRRMHEEMDRLFETFWQPTEMPRLAAEFAPAVDVFEKNSDVVVKANLPGLKKDDIEVTATEDSISLSGEFKKEEEVKEEGYCRRERQAGKFYRTVAMPSAIRPDQVKASFKDGVLEVTAPKAEEAKAKEKKVPVEA